MLFRVLSTMLFALALTTGIQAADTLQLSNAWVRATPPNASVAGAFLEIRNTGKQSDLLLSAETDIAERVEIHEMKMAGDVMQMREVTGGLAIPTGKSLSLKPGGFHLMLIAPKRPLTEGERVEITLRFAKGGEMTAVFAVRRQAPADHAHMH